VNGPIHGVRILPDSLPADSDPDRDLPAYGADSGTASDLVPPLRRPSARLVEYTVRLEHRVAAVLALHTPVSDPMAEFLNRPHPDHRWCKGCGRNYPCPTVRALGEETADG
jgi:hypothetical protein